MKIAVLAKAKESFGDNMYKRRNLLQLIKHFFCLLTSHSYKNFHLARDGYGWSCTRCDHIIYWHDVYEKI